MAEKEYTLGLIKGGLCQVEYIATVKAKTLRAAKQAWAERLKLTDPEYWNKKSQTYWGCFVVEVT